MGAVVLFGVDASKAVVSVVAIWKCHVVTFKVKY